MYFSPLQENCYKLRFLYESTTAYYIYCSDETKFWLILEEVSVILVSPANESQGWILGAVSPAFCATLKYRRARKAREHRKASEKQLSLSSPHAVFRIFFGPFSPLSWSLEQANQKVAQKPQASVSLMFNAHSVE